MSAQQKYAELLHIEAAGHQSRGTDLTHTVEPYIESDDRKYEWI